MTSPAVSGNSVALRAGHGSRFGRMIPARLRPPDGDIG
jgi:hypothetical protein